jgi:hypothetical protein
MISRRDVEVVQRRGLYTKAFAKLIVTLIVTSDRKLREEFGTSLKLELKLAIGVVGQVRCAFSLHRAEEIVPEIAVNSVGGLLA